jgi:molybdate transport system substrate-binding protein
MLLVAGLACGPGDSGREGAGAVVEQSRSITVSAAASLTDAFQDIAEAFEARHPGAEVTLNLAGSSALATQIREGAPVHVFAAADPGQMEAVAEELAGPPRIFATNRLRIAVPAGNPGGVAGIRDLGREELVVGLCASGVPCGDLAREALARAGVGARPDTEEPNVRALLTKVGLGEVDAAIVYASDIPAGGPAVQGIDIPDEWSPVARYPIAVVRGDPPSATARDFVAFVLSDEARGILTGHGFEAPREGSR